MAAELDNKKGLYRYIPYFEAPPGNEIHELQGHGRVPQSRNNDSQN
jgi:hypothetical protein